jgi:hypothetical protein
VSCPSSSTIIVSSGKRSASEIAPAAPLLERAQHAPQAIGPHRPDHAGLDQHLRAPELVEEPSRQALAVLLSHLFLDLLVLQLERQILQGFLERRRDHRPGEPVGHVSQESAGRVPRQPQDHLGAAVVRLAQAPPHPMVDARDARPRHVGVLVALHDLDEAADVRGADPHADREPCPEALLVVPALEAGDAVPEALVVVGLGDELPDPLRRRVDGDVALDSHQPSTGSERSSARPVRAVCISVVTRS